MTTPHLNVFSQPASLLLHTIALVVAACSIFSQPIAGRHASSGGQSEELLHDVLHAVERATRFFKADYSSVNVDGLFGIRLAQGNIIEASRYCDHSKTKCPPHLTSRLLDLNQTIGELGDKALPYIQDQDSVYFSRFSPTIDGPYIVSYQPVSISKYLNAPGSQKLYLEEEGDACMAGLMGTLKEDDGSYAPKCSVTDSCWELVTKPDQREYSITHQLLFFIIGEKTGCADTLNAAMGERKAGSSIKEQEKTFCGHIVEEMTAETRNGNVLQIHQDLFLEQTVLCGTLGYSEIFTPEWIRMVLGWQNAKGCFSMPGNMMKTQARIQQITEESRRLQELLKAEAEAIDNRDSYSRLQVTGRKLLRERIMGDECLSHKSGLGFGVLGAYLRYMIQKVYS